MAQQQYSDPKTIFLLKLVTLNDLIAYRLAEPSAGSMKTAARLIGSLISQITIDTKDDRKMPVNQDLLKAQELFVYEYDATLGSITSQEIRILFHRVNQYLNATYFKEFRSFHYQNEGGGSFGIPKRG